MCGRPVAVSHCSPNKQAAITKKLRKLGASAGRKNFPLTLSIPPNSEEGEDNEDDNQPPTLQLKMGKLAAQSLLKALFADSAVEAAIAAETGMFSLFDQQQRRELLSDVCRLSQEVYLLDPVGGRFCFVHG